jgi:hypothetical protein
VLLWKWCSFRMMLRVRKEPCPHGALSFSLVSNVFHGQKANKLEGARTVRNIPRRYISVLSMC